jgi:hypothetical protein
MNDWLLFLASWGLIPLATIAVFEGTRRVKLDGAGRKAGLLLAFGLAVFGVRAGYSAWASSALEDLLIPVERPPVSIPEVAARLQPVEREVATRMRAQIVFEKSGRLVTYDRADGEKILYAPSQTEIERRERQRESLIQVRSTVSQLRTHMVTFVLAAIVAGLAGGFVRRHESSGRAR